MCVFLGGIDMEKFAVARVLGSSTDGNLYQYHQAYNDILTATKSDRQTAANEGGGSGLYAQKLAHAEPNWKNKLVATTNNHASASSPVAQTLILDLDDEEEDTSERVTDGSGSGTGSGGGGSGGGGSGSGSGATSRRAR